MIGVNADLLVRGILVGLASSITVGPVAVLCIQRTLSKSRYSGFLSGLGVACADTMLAVIAYFFYALLKGQIEQYKDIISIVGGVFVVIVGIFIFFQKPAPQVRRNHTGSIGSWRDFVSMFGFTMANFVTVIPYIFAFFAMLGVEPHDGSRDMASIMSSFMVLAGFFIGAAAWWFVLTFIISLFRSRFQPQHMHLINRVAGVIIGLLGVITILSTVLTPTLNGTPK
jgi:threonine/homoserine/homoserine lactone efflux protein